MSIFQWKLTRFVTLLVYQNEKHCCESAHGYMDHSQVLCDRKKANTNVSRSLKGH